jgi:hypothetical protein
MLLMRSNKRSQWRALSWKRTTDPRAKPPGDLSACWANEAMTNVCSIRTPAIARSSASVRCSGVFIVGSDDTKQLSDAANDLVYTPNSHSTVGNSTNFKKKKNNTAATASPPEYGTRNSRNGVIGSV